MNTSATNDNTATPPDRQTVVDAMTVLVEKAARARRTISVETEAARLISEYPHSGMSHDELRDALCRMAAGKHVTVAFG